MLAPLSVVWRAAGALRGGTAAYDAGIPVICVGNLTVGGTGKTPVVQALMQAFEARAVHVVSRGYGGALEGPVRVDERQHVAAQVGDEPLMLSAFGPVWVSKSRAKGVAAAKEAGAEIILLDDGFQNPSVKKDRSLLVVDAGAGYGNGRIVPAGPLREPVTSGYARADAVVLIGTAADRAGFLAAHSVPLPVWEAELRPLETGMEWEGLRALAFAGIGRPEKFFASLKAAGADLVQTRAFGDHAPYRPDLLKRLISEARALGAQLVTTEKDAVRLPQNFRKEVVAFPVRLHWIQGPDMGLLLGTDS